MKVVLVTAPPDAAERVAAALVDERVAACVNLVPGVASVYRWRGEVERAAETLLVAKTSDEALDALFAAVARVHPYAVPEIVAIDAARVHAPYLAWIRDETRARAAVFSPRAPKKRRARDDEQSERGASPRELATPAGGNRTMPAKKKPVKKAKKAAKKKKK